MSQKNQGKHTKNVVQGSPVTYQKTKKGSRVKKFVNHIQVSLNN